MNKATIGLIIAVVVVGAIFLLMNNKKASAPTTNQEQPVQNSGEASNETSMPANEGNDAIQPEEPVTVTFTDSGFAPASVTIKKGQSVMFANDSTKSMWPASAPHPAHTDYPEFDAKQAIVPGGTWTFAFERVGTWKYHNHLNPSNFGSVTVTE